MYNFIKMIRNTAIRLVKKILWTKQMYTLAGKLSNATASVQSILKYRRVLIIVPHADDELIGCYTLIKEYKESTMLFYLGLTGINHEERNRLTRQSEFEALCRNLKIKYVRSECEILKDLEDIVKTYSPDLILLPSYIDWHREHRAAHYYLEQAMEAVGNKPQIGLYKISMPIINEQVNYVLKMNKTVQKEKWDSFKACYSSQKNIPVDRYKYEEKLYGKLINEHSAEVYSIIDYNKWKVNINRIREPLIESKINELEKYIDDIYIKYLKTKEIMNIIESDYIE